MYVPVLCPFCGKKISNKYNLKTHVRNMHIEVLQGRPVEEVLQTFGIM